MKCNILSEDNTINSAINYVGQYSQADVPTDLPAGAVWTSTDTGNFMISDGTGSNTVLASVDAMIDTNAASSSSTSAYSPYTIGTLEGVVTNGYCSTTLKRTIRDVTDISEEVKDKVENTCKIRVLDHKRSISGMIGWCIIDVKDDTEYHSRVGSDFQFDMEITSSSWFFDVGISVIGTEDEVVVMTSEKYNSLGCVMEDLLKEIWTAVDIIASDINTYRSQSSSINSGVYIPNDTTTTSTNGQLWSSWGNSITSASPTFVPYIGDTNGICSMIDTVTC